MLVMDNGKSTLTDIFASIFDKYTDAIKPDIFNDDKKADRSLITLRNKRFVYASELSGDYMQPEMFKRLVGDKRIKLNKLFKEVIYERNFELEINIDNYLDEFIDECIEFTKNDNDRIYKYDFL